jgi:cysteine desulfurase family protein
MLRYSFNSGRGGYKSSVDAAGRIFEARQRIGGLINCSPENIAFMPNCTYALNTAIKGVAEKGSHIIISNLEHNSVARPVYALEKQSIAEYSIAQYSFDKEGTIENFRNQIRENTRAIVCMHASNVFGCVFPIKEIGEICRQNGIIFIVDAAQSAGVLDIDMKRDNIDILCAPGHKGLYGPMGTGFIALADGVKLNTLAQGGTGSRSVDFDQPEFMPDRLEAGTLNNIGIIGLSAGVDFVQSRGVGAIFTHELELCNYIYSKLKTNPEITLCTPAPDEFFSAPIISFNYGDYSSEKTAALLADRGIAVRAGLHCSPLAHTAFNTLDRGTVRVSPSVFNTRKDCEKLIFYLKNL